MMLVLKLYRPTLLNPDEVALLPLPLAPAALGGETEGATGGIVAQGRVELAPDKLALLCFELGQLFPEGNLTAELEKNPEPPAPTPSANPWALAMEGRFEEAEKILGTTPLDSLGRDRLRPFLNGTDPKGAVFACHVAAATQWRSIAVNLKGLLSWADADVKIAAMEAISVLAGPALAPSVRPLMSDADERVRKAAAETMKKLGW
jgi:hypothetical protein